MGFVERLSLNYGYITQDKSSGGMISQYAQNYMRHKLSASLMLRPHRNISLVVNGSLYDRMGSYRDAQSEVVDFKPYALLDARVTWELRGVKIYIDATNITSAEYYDYGGVEMPPIWTSAGVVLLIGG